MLCIDFIIALHDKKVENKIYIIIFTKYTLIYTLIYHMNENKQCWTQFQIKNTFIVFIHKLLMCRQKNLKQIVILLIIHHYGL